MIRPTARLLALAALGPPIATALILIDPDLWLAAIGLAAALALLALLDGWLGLSPRRLRIEVEAPPTLPVGLPREGDARIAPAEDAEAPTPRSEEAPERLILRFDGPRGGGDPRIEGVLETGARLAPTEPFRFRLGPSRRVQAEIPLQALRRGEAEIPRLWLRWTGPFGLSWKIHKEPLDLTIPAIPDLRGVRRAALALDRRSALFGLKPQSMGGDGAEFDALREYQAGMDRRGVDWKRTAKHRKLLVKEFQAERNHNVVLAIDSGHLMREPLDGAPKLDHAINAALTIAYQALAEGDRAGAFGFDAEVRLFHPPRPGKSAFPAVQKALSTLDYRIQETNFTLGLTRLATLLDRRSIIVLITDFLDTVTAELMVETLGLIAKRHLVVFAALKDPALERAAFAAPQDADALARSVAAQELVRERRMVLSRLRHLGIETIDAAPRELDTALLNRYLRAKRRTDAAAA